MVAAELTQSSAAGAPNTYDIVLHNNSTAGEAFSGFTFAGVQGRDYMAAAPAAITVPEGWSYTLIHGGTTNGYAIQFTPSTPLGPSFRSDTSTCPSFWSKG